MHQNVCRARYIIVSFCFMAGSGGEQKPSDGIKGLAGRRTSKDNHHCPPMYIRYWGEIGASPSCPPSYIRTMWPHESLIVRLKFGSYSVHHHYVKGDEHSEHTMHAPLGQLAGSEAQTTSPHSLPTSSRSTTLAVTAPPPSHSNTRLPSS